MKKTILAVSLLILLACVGAESHDQTGFQIEVLVNGSPVPKYFQSGKVYVEALKNQEYSIRLTNPSGRRVAVALAVDGLNSIDARTSDAFSAKKWVLGPYETITIDGWQVNQQQARKFFFTTETKSYGQWLGKTQNLGIISAVFYRERPRWNEIRKSIAVVPREDSSEGRLFKSRRPAGSSSNFGRSCVGGRPPDCTIAEKDGRLRRDRNWTGERSTRFSGSTWSWSQRLWLPSICATSFGRYW